MMKKILLVFLILFFFEGLVAQIKPISQKQTNKFTLQDSSKTIDNKEIKNQIATIDLYKKIGLSKDTIAIDTTLSIKKEYKFNYLQKDNFGLLPFANMGQTYNSLSVEFKDNITKPLFGARARHFNYLEDTDINYYEVPTPWTRLTYKTAFEQGQMLDAFFTLNLSKQFNFSIAYKGLRSLGNYQNVLTSSGNFRFTTTYTSKSNRYRARAHIVMQDLLNQENGGLTDEGVEEFRSGEEEFLDRSVFDPNFANAENILEGKRFYLDHSYDLFKTTDSLSNNSLGITNKISFEDKYYQFYQESPTLDFFGESFTNNINDKVTLEHFNTQLGLKYYNNILGKLTFGIYYTNINYGYNKVVLLSNGSIPNRIKNNFLGINASYTKKIGKLNFSGKSSINLSDELRGNFIKGKVKFNLNSAIELQTAISISSRLPNYNFLLYQSDYINYNWYNFDNYKNVNTQQINFILKSDKFLNASLDIINTENYTYFNLIDTVEKNKIIKPAQYTSSIQYLKLKIQKELKFGNFALDNTIMYQNTVSEDDIINVPSIITRNTLYYRRQLFKKAMTLQTGITLNYFTQYKMNGYDPLLAEFYTQNTTKLGGFPRLDFFINAKIRQTRIFLKAEHFNSSFTGYDYFSAPNHPYRDFTIRFGLVWDFFL